MPKFPRVGRKPKPYRRDSIALGYLKELVAWAPPEEIASICLEIVNCSQSPLKAGSALLRSLKPLEKILPKESA